MSDPDDIPGRALPKAPAVSWLRKLCDATIHDPKSGRIFRFIIAGGFASAVYYVIAVSVDFLHIMPTMAVNTLAYCCGIVASYTSQKYWAFRDSSSHGKAFPRFLASALSGLGLNSLIVWLLLSATVPYYIASFVATVLVAVFSYFVQRFFVFTKAG